jgi:hypothetical protein
VGAKKMVLRQTPRGDQKGEVRDMEENNLYSLLEVMDRWPNSPDENQIALDKEDNNQHVVYSFYQSKECDHQCIDCFFPFCLKGGKPSW